MHHFAPQLLSTQQPAYSLRAAQYRKKLKSTQHPDNPDHPNSTDSTDADHSDADADADADAHAWPFPHAPAARKRPYRSAAALQKHLAAPPSRLFTLTTQSNPTEAAEATNLRRKHLNVLSTVLHASLLKNDYHRAARAWGMILRTQATGGRLVDLRNHGRWAFGAEILLRNTKSHESHHDPATDQHVHIFTPAGFELAREYYERLIVQHPTRKQAPHAIDQRSFYPAMFSLWIQQVYQTTAHQDLDQVETAVREIAQRLDDLVQSPPFDTQASLLQLRANTALWISDLTVGNSASTPLTNDEWDAYLIHPDMPVAEQTAKFTACRRELLTAQAYLVRVGENGGPSQHRMLSKIQSRLKDLQRQIAVLEGGDGDVSMEDDSIQ